MLPLFWLSLSGIAWTYAGYPLAIAAAARIRPRSWQRATPPPGTTVTIILPIHNGAHLLASQLDNLLDLPPGLVPQILIVSDGSRDSTPSLLLEAASRSPRIQPLILQQQVGKASALNHALAAATSDFILFLDIRPRMAPGALQQLLANFHDPSVGCVAGELVLSTSGQDAAASAVSGVYWRYEQWIRNCEAAFDSPVGVYGGFYAIRRSLASLYPPGLVLDDMFQPLSIIRQGYRSVLDRSAIVHDAWPAKTSGEFQRKVRTLAGNFQLLQAAPWVLSPRNRVLPQLISHKLLRLVVPYLFVTLLLSSVVLALHSPFFALVALAQIALWSAAALSLRVRLPLIQRYAAAASALLVLNAAAVVALFRFLTVRVPLWQTWSVQPASPTHTAAPGATPAAVPETPSTSI